MSTYLKRIFFIVLGALALSACVEATSAVEELTVVPPGKADNFLSASAQEYIITGTYILTLGEEFAEKTEEERLEYVHRLIPVKHIQFGWFLNIYVVDKSEKSSNKDYGGFEALTKNARATVGKGLVRRANQHGNILLPRGHDRRARFHQF